MDLHFKTWPSDSIINMLVSSEDKFKAIFQQISALFTVITSLFLSERK